jgi:hypothetical protein
MSGLYNNILSCNIPFIQHLAARQYIMVLLTKVVGQIAVKQISCSTLGCDRASLEYSISGRFDMQALSLSLVHTATIPYMFSKCLW